MKVDEHAEEEERGGPVEAGDGNRGLNDGKGGGGGVGEQAGVGGGGDGEPGIDTASEHGDEDLAGVLGGFFDDAEALELVDVFGEGGEGDISAGQVL
jgi:hypothetical protein